jgi:argininosuccinate synthase
MTKIPRTLRPPRIVLAYGGDFDSSVAIPWLAERQGAEVVTLTLDFGQGRDLEHVRDRALTLGAVRAHVVDVREEFARDYLLRALKADALFDGGRRLAAALGHSAIAGKLVEIADIEQARLVAHGGVTSAARIRAAAQSLNPSVSVVAPAPEWGPDRTALLAYAGAHRLVLPGATAVDPCSTSAPTPAAEAPREAAAVEITFQAGTPVAINGVGMTLLDLMGSLDFLAGKNGVGRCERFETPAASVLAATRARLQQVAGTADANGFSKAVGRQYADLVDSGSWFTVLRTALDAFIDKAQEPVNGVVRATLFQGVCEIVDARVRESRQEPDDYALVRPLRYRA